MMARGKNGAAILNARSSKANQSASGTPSLFVEVFPLRPEAVPPLVAYTLAVRGDELTQQNARRMGGRAADLLREWLGGAWSWLGGRLVTDQAATPDKLALFVEDAHAAYPRAFAALVGIEPDPAWMPTAINTADWVARGPISARESQILDALNNTVFTIKNTRVSREYRIRTWSVDDTPAISISVLSRLLFEPDLQGYAASLKEPAALVGLWVADKTSGLSGEIVKLVGPLGEQRARLLELATTQPTRSVIEQAPADHWVVRVAAGLRDFDYVTDALDLIIRPDNISQFSINAAQLDKALHLKPAAHAQMVKLVSDVLKEGGVIGNAFNSRATGTPHLFEQSEGPISVQWGSGRARPFNPARASADFAEFGPAYTPISPTRPLRVAVIDAASEGAKDFLEALRRAGEKLTGAKIDVARVRDMRVVSQANMDSAVRLISKENADVLIIALPDEAELAEDEAVNERFARQQTIGRAQPALIVHESMMQNPEAMPSIVMGLVARAGAAPFLLAEPLPFADRVIGLCLVYQEKRDGNHVTGIARIYSSDGRLISHGVANASLRNDEGLPNELLVALFPEAILRGHRAIIHVEGKLSSGAARAIGRREDEIDASFSIIEIMRAAVPRLYAVQGGQIEPPPRGSLFRINEQEAFVVSANGSVQPLHVRAEAPLMIDQAVESVLRFSLLHYGALRPLKLPVTLHNMDCVASGIARGTFPAAQQKDAPYWL